MLPNLSKGFKGDRGDREGVLPVALVASEVLVKLSHLGQLSPLGEKKKYLLITLS